MGERERVNEMRERKSDWNGRERKREGVNEMREREIKYIKCDREIHSKWNERERKTIWNVFVTKERKSKRNEIHRYKLIEKERRSNWNERERKRNK